MAAEKGYDYVLIKGSAGGVLFGREELDITKAATAAINEEHKASKSKLKDMKINPVILVTFCLLPAALFWTSLQIRDPAI